MRVLSIAAIQTAPVPGDLEATWDRFEAQVRAAKALRPHVNLVVVPELLLAAPGPLLLEDAEADARAATHDSGPRHRPAVRSRRDLDIWLVPGTLVEQTDDGRLFNTALAISPDGYIVARYRKLFPWRPYEELLPGSEFVTFDIPGVGRVGLAICFDGSFPEVSRQLAWLGAEVIIQPTLTTTRDREMEIVMARANAFANQVYRRQRERGGAGGCRRECRRRPRGNGHADGGRRRRGAVRGARPRSGGAGARVRVARDQPAVGQLADQCALLQYPMFGGATVRPPHWVRAL